jgi:excisionase family DNA binding protein
MDTLLYGRRESAQLLSISLRTVDQLIAEEQLSVRRVGKRVLVLAQSLREYANAEVGREASMSHRKDAKKLGSTSKDSPPSRLEDSNEKE